MQDCVFCNIINGDIPAEKVYEDDKVLAFRDINPQAPVHVIIIPKNHIASIANLTEQDSELMGHIIITIAKIAEDLNLTNGYRVLTNQGEHGGQTVFHLHFHILGGRELDVKMG